MQKHLALPVPDGLDPGSCCILWAELHHIARSAPGRSKAQIIELQLQDVHGITVQSTMVTSYHAPFFLSLSFAAKKRSATAYLNLRCVVKSAFQKRGQGEAFTTAIYNGQLKFST